MSQDDSYVVLDTKYGKLSVFKHDSGAATLSLLKYGEWAENEITFLRRFIDAGSTVVDVGAYVGTHTLAFRRFVGKTGRVIALEAQPETFELLKKSLMANLEAEKTTEYAGQVRLEQAVAFSEEGWISIPIINALATGSFGSASLAEVVSESSTKEQPEGNSEAHATVRTLTIDSLSLDACSLLKIDVEGMEDAVLRGASETLSRYKPIVYCECNSVEAGMKSMLVLKNKGYQIFAHVVDAFNPQNHFGSLENIFEGAREVALLGIPKQREGEVKDLLPRAVELLIRIEDADDLALALLNKPQYPGEILRGGQAATSGGAAFLDKLDVTRLNNDRLEKEVAILSKLRADGLRELAQVHGLLTQCDVDIKRLQEMLRQRSAELEHVHGLLTQRDTDIKHLQELLERRDSGLGRFGED
jgi:FkbM family methyltransferase